MFYSLLTLILVLCITHASPSPVPKFNRGLFVIQGLATCGQGKGYCLLSQSCSVPMPDADFQPGLEGDHCQGLKHGFNPNPSFVCCAASPLMQTENAETQTDDDMDTTLKQEMEKDAATELSPLTALKRTNQIINRLQEIQQRLPFTAVESSNSDKSLLNVILFGMKHSLVNS